MNKRQAFTLVELLVVIGIIALLIGILLPALTKARRSADTARCAANLKAIGQGLMLYTTGNNGFIIPSYTMTNYAGGVNEPELIEGWASILHRDRLLPGSATGDTNVYYCPDTVDVAGVAATGQTGAPPANARGYMDWPAARSGSSLAFSPILSRSFVDRLRVGYWMNADNPIGAQKPITSRSNYTSTSDQFYSSSAGYVGSNGVMKMCKVNQLRRPSELIAIADGLYAGKHSANSINPDGSQKPDCRVGFRHIVNNKLSANVLFADGHVAAIAGDRFPVPYGTAGVDPIQLKADHFGGVGTIYADASRVFP